MPMITRRRMRERRADAADATPRVLRQTPLDAHSADAAKTCPYVRYDYFSTFAC